MSTASLMPTLSATDIALETKRIDKWAKMLSVAKRDGGGNAKDWSVGESWWEGRKSGGGGKYRKLQRRVFKGVPDRWRRAVWGLEMERVAKEAEVGGRIPSLEELELEYTVSLASSPPALRSLILSPSRSAFSRNLHRKTSKSTLMYHGLYLATSSSIHVTDKANERSSTFFMPLDCTAITLEAIARAWDQLQQHFYAILSPR